MAYLVQCGMFGDIIENPWFNVTKQLLCEDMSKTFYKILLYL